jgi:hypothetical protein
LLYLAPAAAAATAAVLLLLLLLLLLWVLLPELSRGWRGAWGVLARSCWCARLLAKPGSDTASIKLEKGSGKPWNTA